MDAVSSAHTSYVQSSTASPSSPAADAHATLDGLPVQAGAAAAVVTALKPAEAPTLEPELIPSCTDSDRSGLPQGRSGLMRGRSGLMPKGTGAPGGVCGLEPADTADFADSEDLCLARAGRVQPNALGMRDGMLAEPLSLAFAECGRRA